MSHSLALSPVAAASAGTLAVANPWASRSLTLPPLGNLDAYISAVNRMPLLTLEEEQGAARRLRDHNDLEAAGQLVMSHLRLVVSISRQYLGYGLAQSDLIQEGNVGLMKAVKRFDPDQGVRLVSYAMHWIKAEIHEYILKNWRMVKVATTKAQRKLFFNLRSMKQGFKADAAAADAATHRDTLSDREIDSVAAWNTPDGGTWLIATAKETHQLVVYDGNTGAMLREIGGKGDAPGQFLRPNGIAVFGDIVFVVERDNQRVQLFELPSFRPLLQFGKGELKSPYGLWLHELAPRELELFVTDSFMADYRIELAPPLDQLDQRVKRYHLDLRGATPKATLVEQFGDTSEEGALRMVESIAGDPEHDRLLIAEEDLRVGTTLRVYDLAGNYAGTNLPRERFRAQAEGVALWACPDGSGYWITTDQARDLTVFHVFDRRELGLILRPAAERTPVSPTWQPSWQRSPAALARWFSTTWPIMACSMDIARCER